MGGTGASHLSERCSSLPPCAQQRGSLLYPVDPPRAGPAVKLRRPWAPRLARIARWWFAGLGSGPNAGPVQTILRPLEWENDYVFLPIPNHLRSFSMRFAMSRVYVVLPIEKPNGQRVAAQRRVRENVGDDVAKGRQPASTPSSRRQLPSSAAVAAPARRSASSGGVSASTRLDAAACSVSRSAWSSKYDVPGDSGEKP